MSAFSAAMAGIRLSAGDASESGPANPRLCETLQLSGPRRIATISIADFKDRPMYGAAPD
jgi:hypothetical protein